MRNKVIKTISILLVFVISLLALSSCGLINIGNSDNPTDGNGSDSGKGGMNGNHNYHDLFPEGYSGGFHHQPGANIEYWWVETHDEVVEAIELLKSHGSTFAEDIVFTCDVESFDVKYCFVIIGVGSTTEKIKWGDNPFDRHAEDVMIWSYAFFEDVTIDDINHSYVSNDRFKAYSVGIDPLLNEIRNNKLESKLTYGNWTNKYDYEKNNYHLKVSYNDKTVIYIETEFRIRDSEKSTLDMSIACIEEIIKSAKVIQLTEER